MIKRVIQKIDATGDSIGRIASKSALFLRGKNKPEFEPHIDGGDIVEVSNIKDVVFTGKKLEQNKYIRHSGHPGGLKTEKLKAVFAKNPAEVLRRAVKQMLPNNKLRDAMMKRLLIK